MQPLPVLILGFSGAGKSTSIRTLNPEETFLINCCNKPLPFKGGAKLYTEINTEKNPTGNMLTTDNYDRIRFVLNGIKHSRPEISNIVIDDSQTLIVHEFMKRHSTEGKGNDIYQLYNSIADHFWTLIETIKDMRNDMFIFLLHHAETNEHGRIQPKTVGKLLNEKVGIASLFTVCLFAVRESNQNFFLTQNDGSNDAKSPDGMFETIKINNDLQLVKDAATLYFQGEN